MRVTTRKVFSACKDLQERIAQLERENAKLVKLIEQCSEDRYARVACLDWVRKHKKCSKP